MSLLVLPGAIDENKTLAHFKENLGPNFGAFISFSGLVRAQEDRLKALSFEIYLPLFKSWYEDWCKRAQTLMPEGERALLFLAHSQGEVLVNECSYLAAVATPHRKEALALIVDFVEDFKRQAPIWKYDVYESGAHFAQDRAFALSGAGILNLVI